MTKGFVLLIRICETAGAPRLFPLRGSNDVLAGYFLEAGKTVARRSEEGARN